MACLKGKFYVEVQVEQYNVHHTENNIFTERKPPNFSRNQYQVFFDTKTGRYQELLKLKVTS